MLATENKRRQVRPLRLLEVAAATGVEPSLDDVLALEATAGLWQAVRGQANYHLVWHRTWGDRLAGEAARVLRELADRLGESEAYMFWEHPPEAIRVPVAAVLRHAAEQLSHQSYLTLVAADATSGLVLGWDHLPSADEYSLNTWGDLAVDLSR